MNRLRNHSFLGFEQLETRVVPAVTFNVVGQTLTILGDDNPNSIAITDDGSLGGNITLSIDGGAPIGIVGHISIISVTTFYGNDFVSYTQTNNQQDNRKVTVDLGDDDDVFQAVLPKDMRARKVQTITALGGEDDDALSINARGLGIPNGARANWTLDGGDDDDSISFRYKERITGKLVANGIGGEGEDNLFGDFVAFTRTTTGPSTGRIVANLFGGDDDDALTLAMLNQGTSTSPLNGLIDGGDGDNTCVRTANVLAFNCEQDTIIVRA
jgi:hypothetical protein